MLFGHSSCSYYQSLTPVLPLCTLLPNWRFREQNSEKQLENCEGAHDNLSWSLALLGKCQIILTIPKHFKIIPDAGNLGAMLAVNLEKIPFSNLEELVTQNIYKYGILGDSSFVNTVEVRRLLPFQDHDNILLGILIIHVSQLTSPNLWSKINKSVYKMIHSIKS